MLRITRDGAKIIDKKMEFKEDLLSRRKQEKLIFKYLFRFDTLLLNFFLVFLVLGVPMGFGYYCILFALEKFACFQNCILGPRKCSSRSN